MASTTLNARSYGEGRINRGSVLSANFPINLSTHNKLLTGGDERYKLKDIMVQAAGENGGYWALKTVNADAGGHDMLSRVIKLEYQVDQIDKKVEKLDVALAGLDSKVDKMGNALHRLDERTKTTKGFVIGIAIAVVAGIALQIFLR